jgi:hypothetical protein
MIIRPTSIADASPTSMLVLARVAPPVMGVRYESLALGGGQGPSPPMRIAELAVT